ncbi:MAG: xanthine dehydrogenase family protein molybdopterin-binding subunit [Pseudomonadota bacterium]
MSKFGVSQPARRKEDVRFLTGTGRYVDDGAPEGAAHVVFFRAPVAHAEITELDVADAREMPGVLAVYTAADLADKLENSMNFSVLSLPDGGSAAAPVRPILAEDRVRFAGEAVAAVVAETPAAARDAAETILADFEDLDVHVDTAPGGGAIHAAAPGNIAFDWHYGDADATDAAFAAAARCVRLDLVDNRIICNAMEPRGCWAEMVDGRLHHQVNGQGVWGTKRALAKKLGMAPEAVRVTTPDVGGGFGMKSFDYPEQFITCLAAKDLNRAVRWIADRGEGMLTDNGGRDLVTVAEAAFDADHKMTAVRIHSVCNLGAYNSAFAQFIQTELALKVLTGVYDVQTAWFGVQGIYTNTTPIDAYRGAGRPEAIYVMERLIDFAAKDLGVDPLDLRRKNFIPAAAMPYTTFSKELYDVGDFDRLLTRAEAEADVPGFAARRAESAARGKLRGIGLSFYIESILGDQNETTKIAFAEDGMVELFVGTQSNGQGHETVFAQFLHSRAGIPFEKIRFVQGDSDRIAKGGGTGGSRSGTMQGNSINAAADRMVEKFRPLAEEELEVAAADLVFEDGVFSVAGTDRRISIMDLAHVARERQIADLLITELENTVPARSFPYGAHFAEVEIDPDTGVTACVKYTVVDDFGVLMNPMIVEGQVHGGVAQGIGQAITEHTVYDETGQLLTGSFMDYGMPRADDVPFIPFHTELIPSTANAVGMKGCGEAGTVGALAAVTNAALDAVWQEGVRRVDMPLTPLRMWGWLQEARAPLAAE